MKPPTQNCCVLTASLYLKTAALEVAGPHIISLHRLSIVTEDGGNIEVNNPGCYPTVCMELSIDCFAVNTVLQVYSQT